MSYVQSKFHSSKFQVILLLCQIILKFEVDYNIIFLITRIFQASTVPGMFHEKSVGDLGFDKYESDDVQIV